MRGHLRKLLLALGCLLAGIATQATDAATIPDTLVNLTVPNFDISQDDMYVCTTVALPSQPMKLVGVLPRARMDVVHHILLFGCKVPYVTPDAANPRTVWECNGKPMCADGGYNIMYGWGRNAPDLSLPDGVAFSVGDTTGIQYIVAQVHYLTKERPKDDHSGVTLVLRPEPTPYAAGVIAFATGFTIPAKTASYLVPNECCYRGPEPLTTFAMRVHTHTLGRSVYMTRENYNHSGIQLVSKGDPQLPQAFYAVERTVLWPGDRLKVTCDFNSMDRNSPTSAGGTHNDEMCNMYMMVFGFHPFMNMCGAGSFSRADNPGFLPASANFTKDPARFWNPPDPLVNPLGEMTSLVVAPDGALWGLYRGDRLWDGLTFDAHNVIKATTPIAAAVVVRMDPDTGTVLSAWGANTFYMPHMLTLDREGNVWVVDTGLHQVLKFSSSGELLLTLGTKLKPGSGKDSFCKPTKVAILRDGSFFVADGYCNSRVVKFSKDGSYLMEAQVAGGQVIHHILVDECEGRVYIASRENSLALALDINTLAEVKRYENLGGRVWSLHARPYGGILALVWEVQKPAKLVDLESPSDSWLLPGLETKYPHEVALGPAPLALSGAGERLYAAYVVLTCPAPACGPLKRFVLLPAGRALPSTEAIAAAGPRGLPGAPGLPVEHKSASPPDKEFASEETPEEVKADEKAIEAEEEEEAKEEAEVEEVTEEIEEAELEEEEDYAAMEKEEQELEKEEAAIHAGHNHSQGGVSEEEKEAEELEAEEEDAEDYEEGEGDGGEEEAGEEDGEGEEAKAAGTVPSSDKAGGDSGATAAAGTKQPEEQAPAAEELVVDLNEEQSSISQVMVLLVVAAIMASLVVALALHVMRKVVSPHATGPLKPSHKPQQQSIEDMLQQSGALDDVESSGWGGRKGDEERRGLMTGVVPHHKGKAAK